MSNSSCPVQSCNALRRLGLTRLPIGGRAIASAGTLRSRREPTLQRTEPTVHAPSVSYADSMVLGATAKPGDCGDDEPAQEPLDSTRKSVESRPNPGTHCERADSDHETQAIDSRKKSANTLQERKEEAGPRNHAFHSSSLNGYEP